MASRQRQQLRRDEALGIGSISGIVIATLGLFVANRVLPEQAQLFSYDRAALETGCSSWSGQVRCFTPAGA